jgi:hypothetical protein
VIRYSSDCSPAWLRGAPRLIVRSATGNPRFWLYPIKLHPEAMDYVAAAENQWHEKACDGCWLKMTPKYWTRGSEFSNPLQCARTIGLDRARIPRSCNI